MAPQLFLDLAALVGGTVLTMGAGPNDPIEATVATVLIEDHNIIAVGPDLELPPGTVSYDVTGKFVLPGLIDAFAQFDGDHDVLYTAAGITTVRDVGGDRARLLELRKHRDLVPGPRLLTAGVVLAGEPAPSPDAAVFRSADDATRLMPLLFADQVDFLSIFPNMPADAWKRTIELGLEQGLTTWGPVGHEVGMTVLECLAAGQRGFFYLDALLPVGVEWDVVQPLAFRKTIQALADADAELVPMLGATALRLDVSVDPAADQADYFQYLGSHYVTWWREERALRQSFAEETESYLATGQRVFDKQLKTLGMLAEAGVGLVPGSGAPHPWLMPGEGLVEELLLWERAGLASDYVLRAATLGAAEALSIAGSRGQVAVGKVADLVVLDADPRAGLASLRDPELVVMRGQVLEREVLDEFLAVHAADIAARLAEETKPLAIDPPDLPEGEVVLEGYVENHVRDTRISAERWAIVRETGGGVAFCGRVVTPSDGSFRGTDLSVVQHTMDGQLTAFELVLRQEGDVLVAKGVWAGERFQIERRLNNVFVDSKRTSERVVTIDVGSITSALVLGQREKSGVFPVMKLHESFEAEVVGWEMVVAEAGVHLVKTSTGGLVFDFDAKGGPLRHDMRSAEFISVIKVLEQSSFGGPGLPIPEKAITLPPR